MCTPLLPKMHTPRPFIKRCYGRKCKKLCGNRFRSTAEPYIVKKYRKSLVNQGLYKKKLDTNQDTHCIKIGVQLCPIGTKKIFFRFYCMTLNSHILLIKRLYYFCTADKYDLDLFFGLDNHAFQYLSDELVIVCHRMIFQTVKDGINLIKP